MILNLSCHCLLLPRNRYLHFWHQPKFPQKNLFFILTNSNDHENKLSENWKSFPHWSHIKKIVNIQIDVKNFDAKKGNSFYETIWKELRTVGILFVVDAEGLENILGGNLLSRWFDMKMSWIIYDLNHNDMFHPGWHTCAYICHLICKIQKKLKENKKIDNKISFRDEFFL